MNLTAFSLGALLGALITCFILLVLTMWANRWTKKNRGTVDAYNAQTIALMRERNEQEKETQIHLSRIADVLANLCDLYNRRG